MKARSIVLAFAATALATLTTGHASAVESVVDDSVSDPEPYLADYEGVEIDLRDGWDGAKACLTDGVTTECYDSEPEMLLQLAADGVTSAVPETIPGASGIRRQSSCSSYLRLYTGTNFGGSVLAIATRFTVLNLSSYGFNNVTSSYKVGACNSYLYDLSAAGQPMYGGNTSAGVWATTMLSGWDNRISSIYIA